MKVAERFFLKDAAFADEYIKRHREIWPEMAELIQRAGISDYSIWLSGRDIFACYEVRDIKTMKKTLGESRVKRDWDFYMSDIICFEGSGPGSLTCAFFQK